MKSKVDIRVTKHFLRELKKLAKKFPSLKKDLTQLNETLLRQPETGTALGGGAFKIRLAIRSKAHGKSGGARVITFVQTELVALVQNESEKRTTVNLLSIYDKSEVASISKEEIRWLVDRMEFPQ